MMAELSFPFWIVTQRHGSVSRPIELEETPGFIAVFTTAEMAASFMAGRGESKWENRIVARSTVAPLLKELRRMGMRGVCVDPVKGEGKAIIFDEIESALADGSSNIKSDADG